MSMLARRAAFRAVRTPARPLLRRTYAEGVTAEAENKDVLSKGAKRDPELYVYLPSSP